MLKVPSGEEIRDAGIKMSDIPDNAMVIMEAKGTEIEFFEVDPTKICLENVLPEGINLKTEYDSMAKLGKSVPTATDSFFVGRFNMIYGSKPTKYQVACALVLCEEMKDRTSADKFYRIARRFRVTNTYPLWKVFMIYAFNKLWEIPK